MLIIDIDMLLPFRSLACNFILFQIYMLHDQCMGKAWVLRVATQELRPTGGGVVEVQEEIVLVTRAQSDSVGEPLQRPLAHSQGASNVLIRH